MNIVKILSLIFLAIYLVFSGLVSLMGLQLHWIPSFLLGLSAVISGILMLLSINEYYHFPEEWIGYEGNKYRPEDVKYKSEEGKFKP